MRRLFVLAALVFALDAPAQPRFVPLGDVAAGHFFEAATGVSADGSVVLGSGNSA